MTQRRYCPPALRVAVLTAVRSAQAPIPTDRVIERVGAWRHALVREALGVLRRQRLIASRRAASPGPYDRGQRTTIVHAIAGGES